MSVWHGGLSGSAPLKVAEAGHFAESTIGVVGLGSTLFSALNFAITGIMVALVVVLFRVLTPRDTAEFIAPDVQQIPPLPEREAREVGGVVAWVQDNALVGTSIGLAGLVWTITAITLDKLRFDINSVNMLFVFLGIALQGGLRNYVDAITDGARSAGAIVLQFPFYFGILGIMKAAGLVAWISDGLVMLSSQTTFPVVAFLSAGLLNLFVPSGGGQWGVQGPILLDAGAKLGVDPSTTIMAFSYGDAWTNMLQPFWALPLLGIMGLKARDIIGYTATVFLLMGVAVPVLLIVLG
jgi:short-chain fatty acids transporter